MKSKSATTVSHGLRYQFARASVKLRALAEAPRMKLQPARRLQRLPQFSIANAKALLDYLRATS